MIQIISLCSRCLEDFQGELRAHRPSGYVQHRCEHRGLVLTAIVENGLVMNWSIAPASTRAVRNEPVRDDKAHATEDTIGTNVPGNKGDILH